MIIRPQLKHNMRLTNNNLQFLNTGVIVGELLGNMFLLDKPACYNFRRQTRVNPKIPLKRSTKFSASVELKF